jgi:hypothetical protein
MMPNFGGPNSAFEKNYNKQFVALSKKLKKSETKILLLLSNPSQVANLKVLRTASYWNALRREINAIYNTMATDFSRWTAKALPVRYRRSLSLIQTRIENISAITETAEKTIRGMQLSTASNQIINGLVIDANETYRNSLALGKQNIARITRTTQQALLSERIVDSVVAEAFNLGNLRIAAKTLESMFESNLLEAAADKKFVQAGSRKYTPSYYAEMVTRTKFHDAHTFAALSQANNFNTDLVQVSSHNTTTAICVPFEGKVFSISGRDRRFPPLSDSPPYHPNCLHLIYPTFESAMQTQGTLDSFSAFSRNKISRPPTPAGFVPVKSRGIKGVA